ncbi:hypothetical protein B0A55_02045 [Friedmanniomyces simplex]|uniref:REJ domain-containing protein n=1 Tax=Friedmanniomyces simplex TaxID=329884 RepID=A0A4U0Y3N6_9PEZI|nr:hypothetical protein B0A55_02045 [Friedmanniomyces simplex]
MRSSIFIAPFLAAAVYAQSDVVETLTTVNGTSSYTTTFTYSVPQTTLLTETNSLGVVTGQPSVGAAASVPAGETVSPVVVTTQPVAASIPAGETASPVVATSQPAVATIPAGLPVGVTSLAQNASGTVSYFSVSVGSSTTVVLGGAAGVAVTTGASAGIASGSAAAATGSAASGSSGSSGSAGSSGSSGASAASATGGSSTASASSSSSSSSSAASANNVQIASAGLLGLGALFAALL